MSLSTFIPARPIWRHAAALGTFIALGSALPTFAADPIEHVVLPGSTTIQVPVAAIVGALSLAGQVSIDEPPSFLTATLPTATAGGHLSLTPNPHFWTVGSDQMVVIWADPAGNGYRRTVVVSSHPADARDVFEEEFEGTATAPWEHSIENLDDFITEEAAIAGHFGWDMAVRPETGTLTWTPITPRDTTGGDQGDCDRVNVRPINPPPGPPVMPPLDEDSFVFYSIRESGHDDTMVVALRMQATPTGYRIRAEIGDAFGGGSTAWQAVSREENTTIALWTTQDAGAVDNRFTLQLRGHDDGLIRSTASITVPGFDFARLGQRRLGPQEIQDLDAHRFAVDGLSIRRNLEPATRTYLADAFDQGAHGSWQDEGAANVLAPLVSTDADNGLDFNLNALAGRAVMRDPTPTSGCPANVACTKPPAGWRTVVHLDLDTSTLDLLDNHGFTVLEGNSGDGPGARHVVLRLVRKNGGLRPVLAVYDAPGAGGALGIPSIDSGSHRLTLLWQAAPNNTSVGYGHLFVDGVLATSVLGRANTLQRLESIAIGVAPFPTENPLGMVRYDNYLATR